jgi:hypothetical protein
LMFDRGEVHIAEADYIVDHYCLMIQRSGSYCCGWLYY